MGIETDFHREFVVAETVTEVEGDSGNNEKGDIAVKVMCIAYKNQTQN
jgi:hypothetical protein